MTKRIVTINIDTHIGNILLQLIKAIEEETENIILSVKFDNTRKEK